MDFFEAIAKRYSHRGYYQDTPVPREDLIKIVNAGLAAPSGCNGQTPIFVIADDIEALGALRQILPHDTVNTASAVIVLATEAKEPIPGTSFEMEDYSAATENILLAATALGYASLWLDGALRKANRAARVAEALHIPAGYTVRVLLPIGVPAQEGKPAPKKSFEERVWFNRYSDSD